MFTVIGIDPGRQGAVARIKGTPEAPLQECDIWSVHQPPLAWKDEFEQGREVLRLLETVTQGASVICIERPLALFHDRRKGLVTVGANYGFLIALLIGVEPQRVMTVNPKTWMARIGVLNPTLWDGKTAADKAFRRLFSFEESTFDASAIAAALIAAYAISITMPNGISIYWNNKCPALFHPYTKRRNLSNGPQPKQRQRSPGPEGAGEVQGQEASNRPAARKRRSAKAPTP